MTRRNPVIEPARRRKAGPHKGAPVAELRARELERDAVACCADPACSVAAVHPEHADPLITRLP